MSLPLMVGKTRRAEGTPWPAYSGISPTMQRASHSKWRRRRKTPLQCAFLGTGIYPPPHSLLQSSVTLALPILTLLLTGALSEAAVSAGLGALPPSSLQFAGSMAKSPPHPMATLATDKAALTGQDYFMKETTDRGVPLPSTPLHTEHVAAPSIRPNMAPIQPPAHPATSVVGDGLYDLRLKLAAIPTK